MSGDPDAPGGSERTVFLPAPEEPAGPAQGGRPGATQWTAAPMPASGQWPAPPDAAPAPRPQVAPGSVLNNIYEVKRFLARGGMGEVYEGFNVNTEERVAIKVMLPALAADRNVQAMFFKEARTLTRLHHPAVVQYRVLAQEPALGIFYIVTEFIEGATLSELLPTLQPTPVQLKLLTRRLAKGLGAAHALGAVHRDMSPDNVLLPDGRIEHAKIIDFGIAKDMDPSKGTIVGDGFAGKLGYVAPEQFGAFDRQVGPWTDVYTLGLVILAAAQGRDVDMGTTLVEAIDKRRAGPDLSVAPPELRPVLAGMLAADPARRLRSMEAVIAALDGDRPLAAPPATFEPTLPAAKPKANRTPLILGAAAAVLLAGGGAVFLMTNRPKPAAVASEMTASLRRSVEETLPTVGCSWLDVGDVQASPAGAAVRLKGVAGRPGAAQNAITGATGRAGTTLADLNLDEVAPVGEALCAPLDVFRPLRAATTDGISIPQRKFEITRQSDDGKLEARAVINMRPPDRSQEVALVGLEPSGKMTVLIKSRADFDAAVAAGTISELGGGAYRLVVNTDHTGWSGLLLITGKAPVDPALIEGDPAARGADWPESFRSAAAQGGWKTDMVWYRTVQQGKG
ncbi:serine/threonine-protein kinase [Phenylobacterium sp. LjRoot225]|uniref:serine/threonine-protein kinase n=1 Tax=Phenylobacterium sp. LjRoot225 TaxID=3342285 RepID=UPI003ECF4FDD